MSSFQLLLLVHIIADFYLQWRSLAKGKEALFNKAPEGVSKSEGILSLGLYTFLYALLFVLLVALDETTKGSYIYAFFIIVGAHLVIEILTCYLKKIIKQTSAFLLYHGLHAVLFQAVISALDLKFNVTLWWVYRLWPVYIALLLIKPTSVFIDLVFKDLYGDGDDRLFRSSSLIGVFERIIIFCLLYLKMFPAIWIIIAAKTLVCYEKLKTDAQSRGKYLVGTLISVAVPILLYTLLTIWYPVFSFNI